LFGAGTGGSSTAGGNTSGGAGNSGNSNDTDDVLDFDDEDERSAFVASELKNIRSHYLVADLKVTQGIPGGNEGKDYDRVGYVSGFPSGFPQQWFDQYYCYDNRIAAAQLIDDIGAAVSSSVGNSQQAGTLQTGVRMT
jgi:hypothetical protein